MHAGCTAHLGDAADALLHVLGGDHHQIGQLVDDDDDLGKCRLACRQAVPVVVFQIAYADFGEEAVALEHLDHGPLQGAGGLLRVGDDRDIEVRDAVINAELDHLRVDHDELDLVGPGLIEQREDQRVHAHRFAGAGGARDEHVRQLCNVADDALAADVLADGKAQLGLGVCKLGGVDDIPQADGADDLVRHLDADGGDLFGDGRDAHVHNAQGQGQIAREIRHARELHALLKLDIIAGDGGAAGHAHDVGGDAEAVQGPLQPLLVDQDLLPAVAGGRRAATQQLHRRENVIGRILGGVDGRGHGLGLRLQFVPAQALYLRWVGNLGRDGRAAGGRLDAHALVGLLRAARRGLGLVKALDLDPRDGGGLLRAEGRNIRRRLLADDRDLRLAPGLRLLRLRSGCGDGRLCQQAQGVVRLLPKGDIRAVGPALHPFDLPRLLCGEIVRHGLDGREGVFVHGRVILALHLDLHLVGGLLHAAAAGIDPAHERQHDQHRQRPVNAQRLLKPIGEKPAEHPGALELFAVIEEHVRHLGDIGAGEIKGIGKETHDRRDKNRDQKRAEAAQGDGSAAVEEEDIGDQEKDRRGEPVAPAGKALDDIGEKLHKGALVPEIADDNDQREEEEEHASEFPADGDDRLRRRHGRRAARGLLRGGAFGPGRFRWCCFFAAAVRLCHGISVPFRTFSEYQMQDDRQDADDPAILGKSAEFASLAYVAHDVDAHDAAGHGHRRADEIGRHAGPVDPAAKGVGKGEDRRAEHRRDTQQEREVHREIPPEAGRHPRRDGHGRAREARDRRHTLAQADDERVKHRHAVLVLLPRDHFVRDIEQAARQDQHDADEDVPAVEDLHAAVDGQREKERQRGEHEHEKAARRRIPHSLLPGKRPGPRKGQQLMYHGADLRPVHKADRNQGGQIQKRLEQRMPLGEIGQLEQIVDNGKMP